MFSKLISVTVAAFVVIGFVSSAHAVEPRPMLTLAEAKKMADACEALAKEKGWRPVNIAILDSGGHLKVFRRMDDAFIGSIQIAQLKANSSAMIPFPTRALGDNVAYKDPKRPHGIQFVPGLVVFPGGLPIKMADGKVVGSIGVSGATSDQDEECAQAGINAIADSLK
jgi:glc operon protein GlcG